MEDKNPINTTIIPPLTDVSPIIKVEEFENEFRMTAGYLPSAIDEMARRVNESLDEELMARLAEQHGYVKPVRCRDCKYADLVSDQRYIWKASCLMLRTKHREWIVDPDDHCSWGRMRENPCRNADESATAFADAPTLETAREPMQPPTFELGA